MKKPIFRKIMALLLVFVIGLLMPACSVLPADSEETNTTAYFSVITDEAETESKHDTEKETNPSQAPPTQTEKTTEKETSEDNKTKSDKNDKIAENGRYDTIDEVALYIHTYGHLPSNYITKKQAERMGWSGGSLKNIAPGCCIGGDRFGNYEGLLPKAKGRTYTECDIGTMNAKSRGAKRIIFSNDGLVFYTDNHYESFTQLY